MTWVPRKRLGEKCADCGLRDTDYTPVGMFMGPQREVRHLCLGCLGNRRVLRQTWASRPRIMEVPRER